MHSILMQDYVLIRGPQGSITTINASEPDWVDLTGYSDAIAYLDCKQSDNGGGTSVVLSYQTAPTKDENLFTTVATVTGLGSSVTVTSMLKDVLTNPLNRWLRWQLTTTAIPSTGPWHTCFRIFLAANPKGSKRRMQAGPGALRQSPVPGVALNFQGGSAGGAPRPPRR